MTNAFDFLIIGGGIVGLATGMKLGERFPRARIAILEKESAIATHQTGRNSGVIHSGIYYKPGSAKARFTRAGNSEMSAFCEKNGIPYEICGKLIVSTSTDENARLADLYKRGIENGIPVKWMDKDEIKEVEPHVRCQKAIRVLSTGIVDYRLVAETYLRHFLARGNALFTSAHVRHVKFLENHYLVQTDQETFKTSFLINCAGLFSDRVAALSGEKSETKIVPFRGEYYDLRAERASLVKTMVYPVPNPNFPFLGVHLTRSIDGRVHAGPNAVLALKREGYSKHDIDFVDLLETLSYKGFWKLAMRYSQEGLEEILRSHFKSIFLQSLRTLVPAIEAADLIPARSGVRAQALNPDGTLVDDFKIIAGPRCINVLNAPSPAATASLQIGAAIAAQVPDDTIGNLHHVQHHFQQTDAQRIEGAK